MDAKVRIRSGDVEIECQGSEEFLKQQVPTMLEAAAKLFEAAGKRSQGSHDEKKKADGVKLGSKTITTVAAKLGCKSGTDLTLAAAAKLSLVDGRDDASRDELLTEIKKTSGYYKSSYASNFTNYLSTLVKGQKLNEVSENHYALPQNVKQELEAKLA